MKQPQLDKWPKDRKQLNGLLLFAQLWEEMLFDYTLDSYKPKRFNTLGLCTELAETYDLFELNILRVASINPIIEELKDCIQRDNIIKSILGSQLEILTSVFNNWNPCKPDKKIKYAGLSLFKICEPIYQSQIVNELYKAISNPKLKEDIINLSRSLLTEILRSGYAPNFIYFQLQNHFFGEKPVSNLSSFLTFINQFDGVNKKYNVLFKLNKEAELLTKNADQDYLKLADNWTPKFPRVKNEKDFLIKKDNEIFIIAPKIDAKDEVSAWREAEGRLDIAFTLASVYVHNLQVSPEKEILVYEGDPIKHVSKLKTPVSPTLRRPDVPIDAFNNLIVEFVQAITSENIDNNTKNRIYGALSAHNVGVNTSISENRLSSLWTALETITCISPDNNTIQTILDRISPVLCLKYFLKLIKQLRNDIDNCIQPAYLQCLRLKEVTESDLEFFTRLLSQKDCEEARKELYTACEANPLLCNRINYFHELLIKPERAFKLLLEHEQRVKWHIQRLYRTRNIIVHAGLGNELVDLLTENVHDYFDLILSEIVNYIQKDSFEISLERIFYEYDWRYQTYKNIVKGLNPNLDSNIIAKTIVFGSN